MKLAVSALHLMHEPLDEVYDRFLSLGTNLIELTDSGYHALNTKRIERLLEIKSSYNLNFSIHAPWADTNLSADDDLIREWILKRIRASIRFTSDLDGHSLVIHPGWLTATDRFMKGRAWELNLRSIRWLLRYANEYGVDLLMENVPQSKPYLLVSVSDFEMFYEEIEFDLGMVLDIAHSHLQGETLDFIYRFGEKIQHVHVSDNHGESDEHLPIGDGSVDWQKTLGALEKIGYSGWVTVESYWDIHRGLEYLQNYI
ncbi:MAG: sugar phosphate isomerase/epimerase family protein [Promethearchaeota archaeon]|jgi:sugar phosphate isomerase/epimerase